MLLCCKILLRPVAPGQCPDSTNLKISSHSRTSGKRNTVRGERREARGWELYSVLRSLCLSCPSVTLHGASLVLTPLNAKVQEVRNRVLVSPVGPVSVCFFSHSSGNKFPCSDDQGTARRSIEYLRNITESHGAVVFPLEQLARF